jgi:hypothetical protein
MPQNNPSTNYFRPLTLLCGVYATGTTPIYVASVRATPHIVSYVARLSLCGVDQPTWHGCVAPLPQAPHIHLCVAPRAPARQRQFFLLSVSPQEQVRCRRFSSAPKPNPTKSTDLTGHSVLNPFLKVFSFDPLRFIQDFAWL